MSPIDRQLMLASGKLISISEAAKNTPYSAEYLSLLARKGRLKAVKISRDWLTTPEAVLEYVLRQEKKHSKMLHSLQSVSFGRAGGAAEGRKAGMRVLAKKPGNEDTVPPGGLERRSLC